jgi:titin
MAFSTNDSRPTGRSKPRRGQIRRRRPLVEDLEGRRLMTGSPSVFNVTTVADYNPSVAGGVVPGSLRWAITQADASTNPAGAVIDFQIAGGGVQTLTPGWALPTITGAVTINGATEAPGVSTPRVVLSGSALSTSSGLSGLTFTSQVPAALEDVAVVDFPGNGVVLSGSSGVNLTGDFLGVLPDDVTPAPNRVNGVLITAKAQKSTLSGDLISANGQDGVLINASSTGTVLSGSELGTNLAGASGLPVNSLFNGLNGVEISAASGNTIGGTAPGAANTISNNKGQGVYLHASANGNTIAGNWIGTNSASGGVGNAHSGIYLNGSSGDTIRQNTLSGNGADGLALVSANSNQITGNLIGTNDSGKASVVNSGDGILIDGSVGNTIGGTLAGSGNLISGDDGEGVDVVNGSKQTLIEGNVIGLAAGGKSALTGSHNNQDGVFIDSSTNNTVGGSTLAARNVISGNEVNGVTLRDSAAAKGGATSNLVEGNFIGVDATGSVAFGNGSNGVVVDYGADNNTIGGTAPGAGNLISGNLDTGILLSTGVSGQSVKNNLVEGNLIGTDLSGTKPLGNHGFGVKIVGSDSNTIGGTTAAAANLISANKQSGVYITSSAVNNAVVASIDNLVEGNYLGTALGGALSASLDNLGYGVLIDGPTSVNNTIGGATVSAANHFGGNALGGVHDPSAPNNLVENL